MNSNSYLIFDEEFKNKCIVVDPASEKCEALVSFCSNEKLTPEYVILTHEHTDHTWGCNTLIDKYDAKVICSQSCKEALPLEGDAYFRFYYDDPEYHYAVKRVDYTIEQLGYSWQWNDHTFHFIHTPGHSRGSICFSVDDVALFSGDTIMQCKPFIPKKRGSVEDYNNSVKTIINTFHKDIIVYPGHGESFILNDFKKL